MEIDKIGHEHFKKLCRDRGTSACKVCREIGAYDTHMTKYFVRKTYVPPIIVRLYEAMGYDIIVDIVKRKKTRKEMQPIVDEINRYGEHNLKKYGGVEGWNKHADEYFVSKETKAVKMESPEIQKLRDKYKNLKAIEEDFVERNQPNEGYEDDYPIDLDEDDGLTLDDFAGLDFL